VRAGSYDNRARLLFPSKPSDFENQGDLRRHMGVRHRSMRRMTHHASAVILGVRDSVGVSNDLRA
jgi:hypothetical protein